MLRQISNVACTTAEQEKRSTVVIVLVGGDEYHIGACWKDIKHVRGLYYYDIIPVSCERRERWRAFLLCRALSPLPLLFVA